MSTGLYMEPCGTLIPVMAFGLIAEAAAPDLPFVGPVTQLGALGLLAIYLWWAVKERERERQARLTEAQADREARVKESTVLQERWSASIEQTTRALQRAYERDTFCSECSCPSCLDRKKIG